MVLINQVLFHINPSQPAYANHPFGPPTTSLCVLSEAILTGLDVSVQDHLVLTYTLHGSTHGLRLIPSSCFFLQT